MKRVNRKGMTLIEIMIAAMIFLIALGALLGSITSMAYIIDISKDKTVATSDLKNMLEGIRATSFSSMSTNFPDGNVNGPASNLYRNIVGNGTYALSNESITVIYANVTSTYEEIKVLVQWKDKGGRAFNSSIWTLKTSS